MVGTTKKAEQAFSAHIMLKDLSTGIWETVIRPYSAREATKVCANMQRLYSDFFEFRVAPPLRAKRTPRTRRLRGGERTGVPPRKGWNGPMPAWCP